MFTIFKKHFPCFRLQSHACGKARWQGTCLVQPLESAYPHISNQIPLIDGNASVGINSSTSSTIVSSLLSQATPQTCGASPFLANELCARLERLSASTHAQTDNKYDTYNKHALNYIYNNIILYICIATALGLILNIN